MSSYIMTGFLLHFFSYVSTKLNLQASTYSYEIHKKLQKNALYTHMKCIKITEKRTLQGFIYFKQHNPI